MDARGGPTFASQHAGMSFLSGLCRRQLAGDGLRPVRGALGAPLKTVLKVLTGRKCRSVLSRLMLDT